MPPPRIAAYDAYLRGMYLRRQGDRASAERAIAALEQAADEGFPCYPYFERDALLASLRGDPAFEAWLQKQKAQWESFRRMAS